MASVTLKLRLWGSLLPLGHFQNHPSRSPWPGNTFLWDKPSGEGRVQRGAVGGGPSLAQHPHPWQGQGWGQPQASRQPPGNPPFGRISVERCKNERQEGRAGQTPSVNLGVELCSHQDSLWTNKRKPPSRFWCVFLLLVHGSPITSLTQDSAENLNISRSVVLQQGRMLSRDSGMPQVVLRARVCPSVGTAYGLCRAQPSRGFPPPLPVSREAPWE